MLCFVAPFLRFDADDPLDYLTQLTQEFCPLSIDGDFLPACIPQCFSPIVPVSRDRSPVFRAPLCVS